MIGKILLFLGLLAGCITLVGLLCALLKDSDKKATGKFKHEVVSHENKKEE